jgi:hypothetical protein
MRYGMGRVGAVRAILALSFLMGCISLLGPVYNVSDYYLFLIFTIYFLIYTISSFYIIWTMRYSFKFRKRKPVSGAADRFMKVVFGSFDIFRVFRKSQRFNVRLELKCRDREGHEEFAGKILDMSSGGCMACIKDLDILHDRMFLSISFPFDDGSQAIELPAEHIWVSEQGGKFYHGFRFKESDGGQQQVIFKFLVRFNKKSYKETMSLAN